MRSGKVQARGASRRAADQGIYWGYNKNVRIEFDPAKDRANAVKHGVALAKAGELEWDWLLCRPDTRRDYRELREIGFAPIDEDVFCVVIVQRGDVLRVISLRRASREEVKSYASALEDAGL